VRSDREHELGVVAVEARRAGSGGGPQLTPHRALDHDGHGDGGCLAARAQPVDRRRIVAVRRGESDLGPHLAAPGAGEPPLLAGTDVVARAAVFVGAQVVDVDHRAQHAALRFPTADGHRGCAQRRPCGFRRDFDDLVQWAMVAQQRGHGDQGAQLRDPATGVVDRQLGQPSSGGSHPG